MSEEKARKEQKLLLGALLTLLSGLFYAFYNLLAKWNQQQGVNVYQVAFFASFISWIGLVPYLLTKQIHELKTSKFIWHFLRTIFGLCITYSLVLSLRAIPLVDAVMLNNSAPIFIPIAAYFILKIPIDHRIWFAIALGIAGIGLILRPDRDLFNMGGFLGLISGIATSLSWVSIRKLSYTEPALRILFYFLTMATIITAIPLIWKWQPLPNSIWLFVIFMGISFLGSLYCFALAAKRMTITLVSILFYSVIIFTVVLDWLFFHRLPSLLTVLGIILVTSGGILSLWLEGRKLK
jgi:drug/metabolite transporter (DMT)-like permease